MSIDAQRAAMSALKVRLLKTAPIGCDMIITARSEAELPSCFELLDCWRRATFEIFDAIGGDRGLLAQIDWRSASYSRKLRDAWTSALRSQIPKGDPEVASEADHLVERWQNASDGDEEDWVVPFHEEAGPDFKVWSDGDSWSSQLDELANEFAPFGLALPEIVRQMLPHLEKEMGRVLEFLAEQWAFVTRCLFEVDAALFAEQFRELFARAASFNEMWAATMESAEPGEQVNGFPKRWNAQIWPWELEIHPNIRPGCQGVVDWKVCSPWDKQELDAFRGNVLVAFYPFRVVSDRSAALLGRLAARVRSGESTETFIQFARRKPAARRVPPNADQEQNSCPHEKCTPAARRAPKQQHATDVDQEQNCSSQEDDTPVKIERQEETVRTCRCCSSPSTLLCSRCKVARYCSASCQRKDWPRHKSADCPVKPGTPAVTVSSK